MIALGIAFIALMIGTVVIIFVDFGGAFSTYAVVEAQLPASSTAVALTSPVEYRHVTVGTVASEGRSVPGGLVSVVLHVEPSMLSRIPAGVRATVTPVSFFGDEYVVLVPPDHIGPATLRAGQTIPALDVGATGSLQETVGDLDHLLLSLHPAELDAALTALAGALQGQGTSLGHNLVRGNDYLRGMLPLWPTVVDDFNRLVPVANQFAASTPDILATLANQTITGNTVDSEAQQVRQAFSGGAALTQQTADLFTAIEQPYSILAADSGPFLRDLSQSPQQISQLLSGLDSWARSWSAAESSGPYINLAANVVVANPADLGLAALGGPTVASYLAGGLGAGFVNPPTYGSSNATLASAVLSAPSPVLAEPAQVDAVSQIVSAVSGSPPLSSDVSTLLLSPVLESLVTRR